MHRLVRSFVAILGSVGIGGSCVELPLERTNVIDPASGSRFIISGPDTVNSALEQFTVTVAVEPSLPEGAPSPALTVASGHAVMVQLTETTFVARANIGLLPVTANIRAFFFGATTGLTAEYTVVLRQRPVSVVLRCSSFEGCDTLDGPGQERSVSFEMEDALGSIVQLPTGTYRYGAILSRSPSVVEVVERPTPPSARIRALGAGTAWIVMLGEGGIADSLLVQVQP